MALPGLQLQIVVMFTAPPTASSAYVLANRMGATGLSWRIILAGTLLSVLTLPFWLALSR